MLCCAALSGEKLKVLSMNVQLWKLNNYLTLAFSNSSVLAVLGN